MSWSDGMRRARAGALVLSVSMLAACGFAPVHGSNGAGGGVLSSIRAAEPGSDLTFAFVRRIEERLGRPTDARWDLTYDIGTSRVPLAIDGSNDITRINIEGMLTWTVTPLGGSAAVLTGQERGFTAYSSTGSTIATFESERDAVRRLATLLADKVVARLLAEAPTLAR